MATYEKYLNEEDMEMTPDMLVSDTLSQEDLFKLKGLALRIGGTAQDGRNNLALMKRVVEKVYAGVSISNEKEKIMLMDIMRFFLSPEKARFRTILSKF
jgi:hypothetical protein